MNYAVRIVRTLAELEKLQLQKHSRLVADVETKGTDPKNGKLLGIALAPLEGRFADGSDAAYVVVQEYLYRTSEWRAVIGEEGLDKFSNVLADALCSRELVGHNYCYDRAWINEFFCLETSWHADTRLMWHMSDSPAHSKKYALKEAQVDVLGWPARGDEELEAQVEARGGKLKNGDHYLADTDVLGYYAGLDAISTAQLYAARKPFFAQHDLWWLLERMMRFSALLDLNTRAGVRTNTEKLERQVERLTEELLQNRKALVRSVEPYVRKLVEAWRDDQAARYQTDSHRQKFLADPSKWKKFNQASDKQKRELFYGAMQLPVVETVKPRKDKKTGRRVYSQTPAVTYDAIVRAVAAANRPDLQPMLKAYAAAEHSETMLKNFASKWLESVRNGRIHPPFNPCGTVSYRISGYKPYFLNLPFDETDLMSCFSCDEGYGGVHADTVSVEPAITAHYSQDPFLLKVFRDGLGDVYLDLALTLFPNDRELHQGYDPNAPCTSEVKERFKRQRKVAKIVQLAVQYTGTEYTVSLSLTKAGFPTTLEEAAVLVEKYWLHFVAVHRMNEAMKRLHNKRGFIRNAVGRVIQVPRQCEKDIPNRVIQSSGHDFLSFWALRIYELCAERGIAVKPILVDCHDSTSNQCPKDQVSLLKQAYVDALDDVNRELGMTVHVRAEIKEFTTLAGLKGDDMSSTEEQEAA